MGDKAKKVVRIAIVAVICAGLIVGYYMYLSNRGSKSLGEESKTNTEADNLIAKDLEKNYPTSPRAVVKMYNRIATVLYNGDYESGQLEKLADQERILMDSELKEYNPRKQFIKNLKAELKSWKDNEESIVSSSVCESDEVLYKTVKGYECAYVDAYYFGKAGKNYTKTYQRFCLRKDSKGQWKILTFSKIDGDDKN